MNNLMGNKTPEQWGIFELTLKGASSGNPFLEVTLKAEFKFENKTKEVEGFYDGDGIYRLRFMPDEPGIWTYKTHSNQTELSGIKGEFECIAPSAENHGPVEVTDTFFFQYADGKPFHPLGTTSYGWVHQPESLAERTLGSLKNSPFNKIRMCILPHYSEFSQKNIVGFPFPGDSSQGWDFNHFIPEYFQIVEQRIYKLMKMGIEADIILFHPYNQEWGFGSMPPEADDRYLRYLINRIGSFRNVWWSLANEYDMMQDKSSDDWERMGQLVASCDIYGKLCSIHNWRQLYAYWKPWITHACIQDGLAVADSGRAIILRKAYEKPVIYDEVCYEGNFSDRWGDLSPQEFIHRFWQALAAGTYVGHGEVLRPPLKSGDHVWTGIGGELLGTASPRLEFARKIMNEIPGSGLEPIDKWFHINIAGISGHYYLIYLGKQIIQEWKFEFPINETEITEGSEFEVEILDTWNMTRTAADISFKITKISNYLYGDIYNRSVPLPEKPYLALLIKIV